MRRRVICGLSGRSDAPLHPYRVLLPLLHCQYLSLRLSGPCALHPSLWGLRNRNGLPSHYLPGCAAWPGCYPSADRAISLKASPHGGCECWDWAADGMDLGPLPCLLWIYLIGRIICQLIQMTREWKTFIDFWLFFFCNLQPNLGRCSKFIKHPPHFRRA